jgi:ankyrin repeat protein
MLILPHLFEILNRFLLREGADINIVDKEGFTPYIMLLTMITKR